MENNSGKGKLKMIVVVLEQKHNIQIRTFGSQNGLDLHKINMEKVG